MLRRLLTAVVVLGIAAIAGLAIADAFRSHEEPEGEPAKPAPARRELPTATEELRDAGAAGTIYVADTDCRVHSLRLPSLAEPQGATRAPACSFAVTPRGEVLEGDGWYPPRLARAVPEGDLVALRSSDGWVLRVEGRAPAWRPDGTLTVIRGGELRAVDEGCDEGDDCTRLLLGARELRAASASPDRPGELRIREAAWLDERRVALVVSFDRHETETETALGIWDGRRLVRALPGDGEGFFDLRASPRGGFLDGPGLGPPRQPARARPRRPRGLARRPGRRPPWPAALPLHPCPRAFTERAVGRDRIPARRLRLSPGPDRDAGGHPPPTKRARSRLAVANAPEGNLGRRRHRRRHRGRGRGRRPPRGARARRAADRHDRAAHELDHRRRAGRPAAGRGAGRRPLLHRRGLPAQGGRAARPPPGGRAQLGRVPLRPLAGRAPRVRRRLGLGPPLRSAARTPSSSRMRDDHDLDERRPGGQIQGQRARLEAGRDADVHPRAVDPRMADPQGDRLAGHARRGGAREPGGSRRRPRPAGHGPRGLPGSTTGTPSSCSRA